MQQYTFTKQKNKYIGTEIATGKEFELVFFHYHACHCFRKGWLREFSYVWYEWNKQNWDVLFKPYAKELIRAFRTMRKENNAIDGVATQKQPIQKWWGYIMRIRHRIFDEHEFRYYYWID